MVGSIIWVLLEIYLAFQQWKKFENLLRMDKVITMSWVYYFFGTQCRTAAAWLIPAALKTSTATTTACRPICSLIEMTQWTTSVVRHIRHCSVGGLGWLASTHHAILTWLVRRRVARSLYTRLYSRWTALCAYTTHNLIGRISSRAQILPPWDWKYTSFRKVLISPRPSNSRRTLRFTRLCLFVCFRKVNWTCICIAHRSEAPLCTTASRTSALISTSYRTSQAFSEHCETTDTWSVLVRL